MSSTEDLARDLFGDFLRFEDHEKKGQEEWTKLILIAMTTHLTASMLTVSNYDSDDEIVGQSFRIASRILRRVGDEVREHFEKDES